MDISNVNTYNAANKINLHMQRIKGVEMSKFNVTEVGSISQIARPSSAVFDSMQLEYAGLNRNFVLVLSNMIENGTSHGIIALNIAFALQFGENGRRNILDMAKMFEEKSGRLKNSPGISNEQKDIMLRLLEKGFSEAVSRDFQSSNADNKDVWRNLNSLKSAAHNAVSNILASNVSDDAKSLMLSGINNAVSHMQNVILHRAYSDAAISHKHQNGGMSRSALEMLVARINEANRQTRDDIKSIIDSSRNQLRKWQPSITMPDFGDTDEAGILDIVDSDDTGEEEPSDDSSDYELVDYQD